MIRSPSSVNNEYVFDFSFFIVFSGSYFIAVDFKLRKEKSHQFELIESNQSTMSQSWVHYLNSEK